MAPFLDVHIILTHISFSSHMAPHTWKFDCSSSQFSQHWNKEKIIYTRCQDVFHFLSATTARLMTKVDIKRPNKHKTHDTTVPTYTHAPKNYDLITATGAPSHQQSSRNTQIAPEEPTTEECTSLADAILSIDKTNWNEIISSKCVITHYDVAMEVAARMHDF